MHPHPNPAKREAERENRPASRADQDINWSTLKVAVENDIPLTDQDLHEVWSDVFITTVIVPFLEQMKKVHQQNVWEHMSMGGLDFVLLFNGYVEGLETAIEVCKEWRG
jgi:hypothetical protein